MANEHPNVNAQGAMNATPMFPSQSPMFPTQFGGPVKTLPGIGMPGQPVYPGMGMQQMMGYPGIPSQAGFPGAQMPAAVPFPSQVPSTQTAPAFEESYIENILRLNLGKTATVYMTFENNSEWNAKIFKGRLEAAGRDHIIISDPQTGIRYLLLMVNLDYITFDEELNYQYPFAGGVPVQGAGR